MTYFLGIDPGKQGGLSVVDISGKLLLTEVMPNEGTDISPHELWNLVGRIKGEFPEVRCWCERVNSRPGSSGKAMFTFGKGFGYLVMVLVGHKIPFQLVPPSTWSKEMHRGIGQQFTDTKSRSLAMSRRLWPDETWLRGSRTRIPHDGMYESALIAEYGRRKEVSMQSSPD